ncbi:MAG: hypothetical protein JNK63_10920 [Chthonomonas sp.]|nr:hypothetical protein [Chthonomonas sp.]
MQELALILSGLAIILGAYAIVTLNKLMRAMEDLSVSLSNTVDKLADVEDRLQESQRQLATMDHRPRAGALGSASVIELIPALLQKSGGGQWVPVAMLGFRAFEAYFRKRRSRRNALPKGDVGKVNRCNADEIEGQVL